MVNIIKFKNNYDEKFVKILFFYFNKKKKDKY